MMYNFDEKINRRGTDSVKWDSSDEEVLPMWVAEMDFKTPEFILNAVSEKLNQGFLGYHHIPELFYSAIIQWAKSRHGMQISREQILPAPGVMAAISAIISAFTESGDVVIIQPPVYNHFFKTIEGCGCKVIENTLKLHGTEYSIDFEDLEIKAADPKAKILLLCNPQNPVGKMWNTSDLEKIAAICERHKVAVISDEIHWDLAFEKHTPFNAVAKHFKIDSFTVSSPCKTFNMAGMPVSFILSDQNENLQKIQHVLEIRENSGVNILSSAALGAAYSESTEWLEEVKKYIHNNYFFLKKYCEEQIPEIAVFPLEATYLVWLDCRFFDLKSDQLAEKLLKNKKLWVNSGTMYGNAGEGFLRINIACTMENLKEGLHRLESFFKSLK